MTEELMWAMMEIEGEKYYIGNASKPAIVITSGPFTAPDAKRSEFVSLYFGRGIHHWNFKNKNQARQKVKEILATAKRRITVFVDDGKGKRLFGEFGKVEAQREGK